MGSVSSAGAPVEPWLLLPVKYTVRWVPLCSSCPSGSPDSPIEA